MPDWRELVRQRLGPLDVDPASAADIELELAEHLEDACEAHLRQGLAPAEAIDRTLAAVPDWPLLASRIVEARLEEVTMVERLKRLWIPGLFVVIVSTGWLGYTTRFRAVGQIPWRDPLLSIDFYVEWLLALPLLGALGAWWSRRAGGSRSARATAALLPVAVLVGVWFVIVPAAILFDRPFPIGTWWRGVPALFIGWVVIPAAALFAGAWPFLKREATEDAEPTD